MKQVVTLTKIQHCLRQLTILRGSNGCGFLQTNLSEDEKKNVERLEKNVLFNKDSDKVMRLQDKGNRFIIVVKQTDHEKANEQIERSSFLKIDYDPTTLHINKVNESATK